VLQAYTAHYSEHRPHRALEQLPPRNLPPPNGGGRLPAEVIDLGRLRRRELLGGLIHEYRLAA
jgi:putative transposase